MPTVFSHTGYLFTQSENKTVLDAARERIAFLYDHYDTVMASFSGGKDSTVVLMLCLEEARARNRLPLKVNMFDDEMVDPDTIGYCEQVRAWPDISLDWICAPNPHTLRGKLRDHWIVWDPDEKAVWIRPRPSYAILQEDHPEWFRGMSMGDVLFTLYPEKQYGRIANAGGIRAQESFNRRRTLLISGDWIVEQSGSPAAGKKWIHWAKPIFDWRWQDVWKAIGENGWPYSAYYDKLWLSGITPGKQRVGPWGNASNLTQADLYSAFYPEMWDKAILRLPELKAQSRYGHSTLFQQISSKPEGVTWQEYCFMLIDQLVDQKSKDYWTQLITERLRRWRKYSTLPFPEEPLKSLDGNNDQNCWKSIAAGIQRNDTINFFKKGMGSRDAI